MKFKTVISKREVLVRHFSQVMHAMLEIVQITFNL